MLRRAPCAHTPTQPRAVAGADLRWYLPFRSSTHIPRFTSLAEARRSVESGSGGEVGRGGTGAAGWSSLRGVARPSGFMYMSSPQTGSSGVKRCPFSRLLTPYVSLPLTFSSPSHHQHIGNRWRRATSSCGRGGRRCARGTTSGWGATTRSGH